MEWLGVVLLYLLSGFMKKRQQNARRREIESDPNWGSENNSSFQEKEPSNKLDQLLNDLFEDNPKLPEIEPISRELVQNANKSPLNGDDKKTVEKNDPDENIVINERDNIETLNKNIYHSELADRKEQHLGKKWRRRKNIRKNLFRSKRSIKKSIIIKEVLDKPIALRK
tara:strand:+ start:816 stop:1322 length:507 start_codon:yes stop_codon:yes gene_type:complete